MYHPGGQDGIEWDDAIQRHLACVHKSSGVIKSVAYGRFDMQVTPWPAPPRQRRSSASITGQRWPIRNCTTNESDGENDRVVGR
jgi:hypothetical protein